jgi:hypothetical protein
MKNLPKWTNLFYALVRTMAACFLTVIFAETKAQSAGTKAQTPSISVPSQLLDNRKPVANWIWDSGPNNPKNYYLMIRKTVDLPEMPSEAKAFISAFAYADVYINGRLVDRCPMNCDPEFQVYEKFDLSGYFRKGQNTISAMVYNFGIGMHHRINGRGGFFFQGELQLGEKSLLKINTDDSWKVSKAEAWDNGTAIRTATSNLIGFVEKFDARKKKDHWRDNGFDDSKWQPARKLGIPPLQPFNNIVEVCRPSIFREKVYPVNHWFIGDKVVYDFGKEIAGTPTLDLYSSREGVTLEMGTGERLLPDSTVLYTKRVNFTNYFTCRKGFQSLEPLTWRGFRYLSLTMKDSVIIQEISAINRHYDFTREGSFECSDPLLNRIWEIGNQTLLLCAQDTYMDTPWREQTHYIAGDSRYLQKYAFYPFGMSSEFLMHYNILSGAWSQRWKDDGSIRSRYPTDWLLGEGTSAYVADYELEWVIMLGEYYQYFGKKELIKKVYPNLKKLMTLFDGYMGKEHGLLSKIPGWIVLDHPDSYPMDQREEITGLNCLYYEALKQAAAIAKDIADDPEQAAQWSKNAGILKENIQKWLWLPEKHQFMDSFGGEKCSQQTQVYALLYGLVEETEKEHVMNAIAAGNRSSEQSFSYYVVHSLFDSKPMWSLDFIRKYWGGQMKSPYFNGAWHECWDIANFLTDLMTTSHAWCSGPTALLPQKVLGLEPVSAGWKTFSVRPNPCDLQWAKGVVSSPFGPICAEWKTNQAGNFKLYVSVPEQTTAEIVLPGIQAGKVLINGRSAASQPDIKQGGLRNGRLVYIVQPGEYQFEMSLK